MLVASIHDAKRHQIVDQVLGASGKVCAQEIQQVQDNFKEEDLTLKMLADKDQISDENFKVCTLQVIAPAKAYKCTQHRACSRRRAVCLKLMSQRHTSQSGLWQEYGVTKQGWICKIRELAKGSLLELGGDAQV